MITVFTITSGNSQMQRPNTKNMHVVVLKLENC